MILDRPERIGFEIDEALVLLEHRNLKDTYNRFLNTFIEYVKEMDAIQIQGSENIKVKAIKKLVKIHNETEDLKEFIKILAFEYVPKVNEQMAKHKKAMEKAIFDLEEHNPNRSLFSEETTKKIIGRIENQNVLSVNSNEE